ncbi:hypothetical protein [Aurantiacibacter aquimixticola]|uniref:hypothetical protein n=1 Tax=Aurantiacibacter aquimixticola TaxID=1958945 RepID=UPI001058AFFF|nr:hypothetical protein [Aurantiacibacter aquimixticola]
MSRSRITLNLILAHVIGIIGMAAIMGVIEGRLESVAFYVAFAGLFSIPFVAIALAFAFLMHVDVERHPVAFCVIGSIAMLAVGATLLKPVFEAVMLTVCFGSVAFVALLKPVKV